jgi:tetratricopeptide (TPR) repeat protein
MRGIHPLLALCLALSACPEKGLSTPPDDDATLEVIPRDPVEHAAQKMQQGDPQGALDVVESALSKKPDDPELHFARGVALQALNKVDAAAAAWDAAVALSPEFVPAIHALGTVSLDRGEYADAIERFQATLQLKPDFVEARYNLALALLGIGKVPQARTALEQTLQERPDDADALIVLADIHLATGAAGEARPLTERAVVVAPNDSGAHAVHGRVLMRENDHAGALRAFARAVELQPTDPNARLGLAQAQLRTGAVADAAGNLEALARELPKAPVIWLEWGTALAKLGQLDTAVEKLDRALELDPTLVAAQVRRIGALAEAKRCKEAKAALGVLQKQKPPGNAVATAKKALAGCK